MSVFEFNKIFILESLTPNELQTGTELEKRINQWAPSQGVNCQVMTYQVHSMQEWEIAWNGIYTGIEKKGTIPIIHLEMHGNKTSIGIDGGANGMIPLNEVFKKVQHANVLSQNNIFLSLAVCMGLNVIRGLKVFEPMPFCGVLGSLETLKNEELLENYTIFYKAFLTSLNLEIAEQKMKDAGIDASKYELYKPEQIFMNAYLSYLETYKTDEQIVNKAKAAAKSVGLVFKNSNEERCFIRDYRCTLLMTEEKEYKRAVDTFFQFDAFPSISNRFVVPRSLHCFKEQVGIDGHEWLLNHRPFTEDDEKGISIQILKAVDEFCKENDINYSLAYGTLIGAIRHKGFIPWDDDVDIVMLRPDYDKFICSFNHGNTDLFSVASYETDTRFPYLLAKVMCNATVSCEFGLNRYGFGIDVFPIDKIPANEKEIKHIVRIKDICWKLFLLKSLKWSSKRSLRTNLISSVSKIIVNFIPYSFMHRQLNKLTQKYKDISDNYLLGNLHSPYGIRDFFEKDVFTETIQLPFESQEFCGLKEYDRFLTKVYGDYMKLPPVEAQVTHHEYNPYWK